MARGFANRGREIKVNIGGHWYARARNGTVWVHAPSTGDGEMFDHATTVDQVNLYPFLNHIAAQQEEIANLKETIRQFGEVDADKR